MIYWSIDEWLIGWLIDWLIEWLIEWLIDWSIDRMIDLMIDWIIYWMIFWLNDLLIYLLTELSITRMIDLNDFDWMIDWFPECIWVTVAVKIAPNTSIHPSSWKNDKSKQKPFPSKSPRMIQNGRLYPFSEFFSVFKYLFLMPNNNIFPNILSLNLSFNIRHTRTEDDLNRSKLFSNLWMIFII